MEDIKTYLVLAQPADPDCDPFYTLMTEHSYANHNDDEAELSLKFVAAFAPQELDALCYQWQRNYWQR